MGIKNHVSNIQHDICKIQRLKIHVDKNLTPSIQSCIALNIMSYLANRKQYVQSVM